MVELVTRADEEVIHYIDFYYNYRQDYELQEKGIHKLFAMKLTRNWFVQIRTG